MLMDIIKWEGFKRIYSVDCLNDEIKDQYKKNTKQYNDYLNHLLTQLIILDSSKVEIPNKYFEKLSGHGKEQPLYRIKSKKTDINTRVLYCVEADDGSIILLASFNEKNRSDYSRNIDKAYDRLKSLHMVK